MTVVLLPLDGSDKDARAIAAAAAIAEIADGGLHLVRVLDTPIDSLTSRARTMGVLDAAVGAREDMEREVRALAQRLRTETGRPAVAEVAEAHDVAATIVSMARAPGTELVVMATRAAGALGRAISGSVADRVVRESARPVVLVPPGADHYRGKHVRLERVLVPLDGSALGFAGVDRLIALPGSHKLEYVLLTVVAPAFVPYAAPGLEVLAEQAAIARVATGMDDGAEARATAGAMLSGAADRLRAHGVKDVRMRVVEDGDTAGAIARAVREELADFVALSTRGASGVKRLVLGSVAEGVVRTSEVPVLLVTPAGMRG